MERRTFLKLGLGGLFSLWAAPRLARAARPARKAKACIVVWLNGGPSHIDTFDPKSNTPTKSIATRVPGLQLSEHLPRLADAAQHLCILRGMTSKEGNHDRARHLLHTGYSPNPTVAHPALGAWVSEELGDAKSDLPTFVSVAGPSARAGFLGVEHDPFVVTEAGEPPGNTGYPHDVDMVRFLRRKAALDAMEADFAAQTGSDPKVAQRRAVYTKAVRMMYAPRLRAFDLADEPDAIKTAYGAVSGAGGDFGRGCLLARRLVEAGVPFVEVTLDGWDTHQDNFNRTRRLMQQLDPALSGLIADLDQRKLLDSTLVVCLGEFGRMPQVNPNEGRDHYPKAWSAIVAGGGIRGGLAHGATDGSGANVVEHPTAVPDLFATLATQLGIDPDKTLSTPLGRPLSVTDNGKIIREILS
jgi:hypothetical protein